MRGWVQSQAGTDAALDRLVGWGSSVGIPWSSGWPSWPWLLLEIFARSASDKEKRNGLSIRRNINVKYPLCASIVLLGFSAIAGAQPCPIDSYLYEPSYCLDNVVRGQARKYLP